MTSEPGSVTNGILENPYLAENSSTKKFSITINVGTDSWSYEETTTVDVKRLGKVMDHTDRNELHRVPAQRSARGGRRLPPHAVVCSGHGAVPSRVNAGRPICSRTLTTGGSVSDAPLPVGAVDHEGVAGHEARR